MIASAAQASARADKLSRSTRIASSTSVVMKNERRDETVAPESSM